MNCKDYTKPIWEIIKLEVDPENSNLKWHTCRQKWSYLESDYRNYVKDLKKYMETNTSEMNVFVPQFYEQIGIILRSIDNHVIKEDTMDVFQQFVEDRIAEELQTRDSNELEKIKNDEPVIVIEH
ncbi:hypothetical protein O3M35_002172 [Rhynocoris fuscipes]|uniref:MADF domain-containing protein n=1 Tax=Rhynocoris fuscipes TaxID=488301 RepID=A0AAW1CQ72_9HEMI